MILQNDINREKIYLASLLHDIGKFYQRSGKPISESKNWSETDFTLLKSVLCPFYKNDYRHPHVLWTARFIKEHEEQFLDATGNNNPQIGEMLMKLAAAHHLPSEDDLLGKILQKADHYSYGVDRRLPDEVWQESLEEELPDAAFFQNSCTHPIFEAVKLSTDARCWKTDYHYTLPISEVKISNNFFPLKKGVASQNYLTLWEKFNDELSNLKPNSLIAFSENFLVLLKKYTVNIPASTNYLPDVPLYDHLKTTAAFALCLYDYISCSSYKNIPDSGEKPFLLIGGDLSGIQKFIYGIIARGATKNLKGRSFYLQLLIDNIVKALLDELDLYDSCIVYSSGGGFYLLAPNTFKINNKIEKFKKKISEKIFEFHQADLYLAIASVSFGEEEIFFDQQNPSKTIGDVWNKLAEKMAQAKSQRFRHTMESNYPLFFKPGESGGESKKDAITGEEIKGDPVQLDDFMAGHSDYSMIRNDNTLSIDRYTQIQIQLGVKLKNTDFWVLSKRKLDFFPPGILEFDPIGMGYHNYFLPQSLLSNPVIINSLSKSTDIQIIAINKPDLTNGLLKDAECRMDFEFYGGNTYPESEWEQKPKVLEELAGIQFDDKERLHRKYVPSLVRIGILRMDVDNLGAVFKRGLSPDKRSFSRYSVLSRTLDYFFKGYLNKIWEQEQYRDSTQIIYSGGDDLFLVGKWDLIIKLAREINLAFREWTCFNPYLTLSGGVAFVYPKFPVLKASSMSESEEQSAKSHWYGEQEKNSFSLFNFPVNNDTEFEYLSDLKDEIEKLIRGKYISQGFPSDMYHLMIQAKFLAPITHGEKFKISNHRVVWMIAYHFKRTMAANSDKSASEFFSKWIELIYRGSIDELPDTQYHPLQYLAIASRWADFELR